MTERDEVAYFRNALDAANCPPVRLRDVSVYGWVGGRPFTGVGALFTTCVFVLVWGTALSTPHPNLYVAIPLMSSSALLLVVFLLTTVWQVAWYGAMERWMEKNISFQLPDAWRGGDDFARGVGMFDTTLGFELHELVSRHANLSRRRYHVALTPPPGWWNPLLGRKTRVLLQGACLEGRLLPLMQDAELWKKNVAEFCTRLDAAKSRHNGAPAVRDAYEMQATARG